MRFVPPLVWTAVVLLLGSAYFGADHTSAALAPVLRELAPLVGLRTWELHALVRKAAHVTEYALLAGLWFHALSRRSAVTASWIALCICLVCAFADEAHQSFVPNRTARARDVVIDGVGAMAAVSLARRWRERLDARALSAVRIA